MYTVVQRYLYMYRFIWAGSTTTQSNRFLRKDVRWPLQSCRHFGGGAEWSRLGSLQWTAVIGKPFGNHHFFLGGKSTISTGPFSIPMLVYQRVMGFWLGLADLLVTKW